ncbi:MAG: YHS domain-containing protein [Beijerinckiaceae bacterium]
MAKDPVCGMDVDRSKGKHSADYGGHTYYFCSQGCKAKFAADPASYVDAKPKPPPSPLPGTNIWSSELSGPLEPARVGRQCVQAPAKAA